MAYLIGAFSKMDATDTGADGIWQSAQRIRRLVI